MNFHIIYFELHIPVFPVQSSPKFGSKHLINANWVELRKQHNFSKRGLAQQLQLAGYDMDKNVITRIETNQRYVTDIEIKALCDIFGVTFDELISPLISHVSL